MNPFTYTCLTLTTRLDRALSPVALTRRLSTSAIPRTSLYLQAPCRAASAPTRKSVVNKR
jgi:hypothetical protein